jgi:hypothetical protein
VFPITFRTAHEPARPFGSEELSFGGL